MPGKSSEFRQFEVWDENKKERALQYLLSESDPEQIRRARKKRTERVAIQDYIPEALDIRKMAGKVQGLSTGFKGLDDMTLGMTPGELIIISGPTSAGKTQLTTSVAYNSAKLGHKVLFVTMEMTKPQMTDRFMVAAGTDLAELPYAMIEYQKEHDLASTDIEWLVKDAVEGGTELVVIDHLHYFSGEDDNNQAQVIGRIAKDFKLAAVAYNVPVILICHIRKLERENKKPTGNDLRDSSLIGQHSDQIIMVWRDNTPGAKGYDAMVDGKKVNVTEVEVTNWKNRLRGMFPGKRKRSFYAINGQLIEQKPEPVATNRPPARNYYERDAPGDDIAIEDIPAFGAEDTPAPGDNAGGPEHVG